MLYTHFSRPTIRRPCLIALTIAASITQRRNHQSGPMNLGRRPQRKSPAPSKSEQAFVRPRASLSEDLLGGFYCSIIDTLGSNVLN